MNETQLKFELARERIIDQLIEQYPEIEIERTEHSVNIVHYTASYTDFKKIIHKRTKIILNTLPNITGLYLTEESVDKAISKCEHKAVNKFKTCKQAIKDIKARLDFELSYSVEGDTHGIIDYQYISFKIDGFVFKFTIED